MKKTFKKKYIYFFGEGKAEGSAKMKNLLGGKGANLAEMTNLGIPVPPGFTITTEICSYYYQHNKSYPEGFYENVKKYLNRLEKVMGKKFGDENNPLLVSVRSGAPISMPGMMDTILNLGLTDESVKGLAKLTKNERFAYDSYRRFVQMFGNVVLKVKHEKFEEILSEKKKEKNVKFDIELDVKDLKDIICKYKELIKKETGTELPQSAFEQLKMAINAVFESWNNERAIIYRKLNNIPDDLGTAVNVQAMVFGNMGEDSGTGVCFTRDPSTGKKVFYGEFLQNAQGEDVVAGIRTPLKLEELKKIMPKVYNQLYRIAQKLEKHYRDMQDMEFTIQEGKLYLLQTRTGKRTARAAVKIAVDMVKEKLITKEEAILRVSPQSLDQLLHPTIDPSFKEAPIAKGLAASPGAASGKVVFTAEEAIKQAESGERVILVRKETSPEDVGGMHASQGILTSTGGLTSHAAVVGRGMGKPCVVGCQDILVYEDKKEFHVNGKVIKEGDIITINGSTGEVFLGKAPLIEPELTPEFKTLLRWADSVRKLKVRANADTPHDAETALKFGAEGIGLCRTEHMFFAKDRLPIMQEMILADNSEERKKALDKLLPLQQKDFYEIFKVMKGYPVTIRLLDPPLHEFLPKTEAEIKELAQKLNIPEKKIKDKVTALHEFNPMLGFRGCRLGIVYPEITQMQTRAIFKAACQLKKEGKKVLSEIMVPLVGNVEEIKRQKEIIDRVAKEVMEEEGVKLKYSVGTMIEVPRAALTADKIAQIAEFFSFGTNDLTQMTFGFSRDDVGRFLPQYLKEGILKSDPFQKLDAEGVGLLMEIGVQKGRKVRKDLKIGICGEHGGEPDSVEFCHKIGLDYVSCSPFRIPIARMALAHAQLKELKEKKSKKRRKKK